jgi:hypothetical protein
MDQSLSSSAEARIATTHEFPNQLVQQTVDEIFRSSPFRSSKQSQLLLRYIIDQSLAGHAELLKERLIGVNVFGRRLDYDTSEDPIVRARAAEVRKRLAQFYVGEGRRLPLRIEIAPGSYLASFKQVSEAALPVLDAPSPTPPSPRMVEIEHDTGQVGNETREDRSSRWPSLRARLFTLLGMACVLIVAWQTLRPQKPIDVFWQPLVKASSPVILYSGANAVYMLTDTFLERYKATHQVDDLEGQGREFAVPLSSDSKLGPTDLKAFTNDFITIGDLSANVQVASLLAKHEKRFDLRSGEDVAFGDLRQSPTILIGAFNNSWTLQLTGDLPYTFHHRQKMTIESQSGHGTRWTPVFTADDRIAVDYAVVTRMPHSKTGQPLLAIAGITQAGTRAAADFITDPDQLRKLAASLSKDWAQQNLQVVLQTKVVNNIPTSPVILATKSW